MANYTEDQWNAKKTELMEKCFAGFTDLGLHGTDIRALGRYCGYSASIIYTYFNDLDDLIVQSTAYCMSKVEDEFMSIAPRSRMDLERFFNEVPFWTAEKHGKKYRLMYQVYTHPKYREDGKRFFAGVNQRYVQYAKDVAEKIGLPYDVVQSMIFIFVRACVHYALYEDTFYLQEQLRLLKSCVKWYIPSFGSVERTAPLSE